MKFNLNDYVKVRLTNFGKNILRSHFENLKETYPHIFPDMEFELPQEDSQGYSKWQLWELIETFGEYFYMGSMEIPFELEIEILENS